MRVARPVYSLFAPLIFALICVPTAFGQTTPDLEEGVKPYGSFHGGDIDQVSLSSGKLALDIPLISYPQRGGKIKVGFDLRWQNITPRLTEVCDVNGCSERPFRDANTPSIGKIYFVDKLGWLAGPGKVTSPDQSQHQALYRNPVYETIDATGLAYNDTTTTLQTSDGV